ncbi:hypothetical protein [Lysobacter enzymogenes]|uniref:Uncharacterized protein n=1 Tax=Lysobacter enzymogenes TaxID=69 RepID=A0A0S2DJA5_LYSEN|nr:hypothetical protein [Lysobacter enzymogenes]ALN58595.1 hypothetical protein GLE_3249 [Lysobacter enzymogenes]QCW26931.1 hypothetical protein FE772_16105 [Lysobacter enzymogenes]QQQ03143.1 hypothetical protein JHW41_09370 [Lysobacter enzymogenes]
MNPGLSEGDICTYPRSDGTWGFFWVQRVDALPDGREALSLRKFDTHTVDEVRREDEADVAELKTIRLLGHFPIVGTRVAEARPQVIGRMPVREEDLEGYRIWREAFDQGEAGVFTLELEQI